jgi:inward rectifier potassium channel
MGDLGQTRVFGHSTRGVVAIGLKKRPLADLYHRLVTGTWTRLCLVYALAYLATAVGFSAAHFAVGDPGPVPRGSFVGALVALARGTPFGELRVAFAPRAIAASALEGLEGFVWWLLLVIGAGIVLAKFALLKARVLFSEWAVVAPTPQGSALLFRMANERNGHVVDAKVSVMLVRNELDEDGDIVRRAHDLPLVRGGTALFSHAWTAVHPIAKDSPLAGERVESLARAEAEILVTFSGYDEALTRVINARQVYPAERIRWNARFAPIVELLPDGRRAVDYRRFHDVIDVDEPTPRPERTPRKVREG